MATAKRYTALCTYQNVRYWTLLHWILSINLAFFHISVQYLSKSYLKVNVGKYFLFTDQSRATDVDNLTHEAYLIVDIFTPNFDFICNNTIL